MSRIKVLIADDHTLFRRGIAAVLAGQTEMEVVGEAADGLEAIAKTRQLIPDVVLMDLNMPNCSGLEATQALQLEMPQVKILVLTVSDNEADLFAAVKFGAKGYLLKKAEPEELVDAIFSVTQGGVMVSSQMAIKLLAEFNDRAAGGHREPTEPSNAKLSPREGEVLQLVAKGATNKEIADSLFISENTVKTHLQNIMEKLHLANRSQAAAYAVKKGLAADKEK